MARIAAIALALLCNRAGADVEAGIAAYQRGDFAAALAEFSDAARQNDPLALNVLGIMYAEGRAVARNDKLAADYFFKAQALGSLEAGANLGRMYADGRGVPKNNAEALKHYRDAALGGYLPAMRRLAEVYEKGELGVAPDPALAQEWRARLGGTPTGLMQLRPAPTEASAPPEIPRDRKAERKATPVAALAPVPKVASRVVPVTPAPDVNGKFEKQVLAELEKYRQRERKLQVASSDTTPALAAYLKDLRARLKRHLEGPVPESTQPAGLAVSIAIMPDGTVRGIEVDRASGNTGLDRRVLSVLRQLPRLPPLPPAVQESADVLEVTVRLPVE